MGVSAFCPPFCSLAAFLHIQFQDSCSGRESRAPRSSALLSCSSKGTHKVLHTSKPGKEASPAERCCWVWRQNRALPGVIRHQSPASRAVRYRCCVFPAHVQHRHIWFVHSSSWGSSISRIFPVRKDCKLKKHQLGGSLGWNIAGSKAEDDYGKWGALRELDMALSLLARVSRALWGSTFHWSK